MDTTTHHFYWVGFNAVQINQHYQVVIASCEWMLAHTVIQPKKKFVHSFTKLLFFEEQTIDLICCKKYTDTHPLITFVVLKNLYNIIYLEHSLLCFYQVCMISYSLLFHQLFQTCPTMTQHHKTFQNISWLYNLGPISFNEILLPWIFNFNIIVLSIWLVLNNSVTQFFPLRF